ncbi:hypothetical protein [Leuconostoc lactis]|uniref:hypothetical protein n=1 Tax=Leuconostoc lactis TaxID=1246 RepID=UPI0028A0161F|nr:hypothetical protein [Leuconostoc lactis]
MLTLKQVRTAQFFMDNLSEYCEFHNIQFPFQNLVFEYNNDLITGNWLDNHVKISHESQVNLRTAYLSGYSDAMFSKDKLNALINNRTRLTNLIFKVAQEFDELEEDNWVIDVSFLKSKVSFKNYLFQTSSEFNLVSF